MKKSIVYILIIFICFLGTQCKKENLEPKPKNNLKIEKSFIGNYTGYMYSKSLLNNCYPNDYQKDSVIFGIKIDTLVGTFEINEAIYFNLIDDWVVLKSTFENGTFVNNDSIHIDKIVRKGCGAYNFETNEYPTYTNNNTQYKGIFKMKNDTIEMKISGIEKWCDDGSICINYEVFYQLKKYKDV